MDYSDFINRSNADYIERLYQQYQSDPRSLEPQWQAFFAGFEAGGGRAISSALHAAQPPEGAVVEGSVMLGGGESSDVVHSYRELGHLIANLDPLGHNRTTHPLLDLSEFGLSLDDLDRHCGADGFLGATDGTVRDLL